MLSYIWNGGIYTGSDKVGISSNSGYSVPVEYMGNQIESRINGEISVYVKKFFIIFLKWVIRRNENKLQYYVFWYVTCRHLHVKLGSIKRSFQGFLFKLHVYYKSRKHSCLWLYWHVCCIIRPLIFLPVLLHLLVLFV